MNGRLLEVVIVWQDFGEKVDLKRLRDRLVLLNPPVVPLSVDDAVFREDFSGRDVAAGADDAPVGQLGGAAHHRLGLQHVVVSNLQRVGGAVHLEKQALFLEQCQETLWIFMDNEQILRVAKNWSFFKVCF